MYFEKIIINGSTQNFHKIIYDEILCPDPTKLLPAFFHKRVSIKEVIGRIQRKY